MWGDGFFISRGGILRRLRNLIFMDEKNAGKKRYWLTTSRIESLADNVFAFAMTLLVINLVLPDVPKECSLASVLLMWKSIWPQLSAYVISFIVLALFWMKHHKQFTLIQRVDGILLWLNILIMMLIVLVPFTTQLSAKFDGVQLAELSFDLNLLVLGLLFLLNWFYATKGHRLVDPALDEKLIRRYQLKSCIMPGLALLAMVISFFHASLSSTIYLFLPFILYDFLRS
jgi:uncharacterized membrane protein